jgi:hypothetical protein
MMSKTNTTKIMGLDFDGTCVDHQYPMVGADIPGCVGILRRWTEIGGRIVLFTMRSGAELEDAVKWFKEREIPLFGINRNPDQDSWTSSPKAYANFYVDDAAIGCPLYKPTIGRPYVNWAEVAKLIL